MHRKKEARETIMTGLYHCSKKEGEVLLLVYIKWDETQIHPSEPDSQKVVNVVVPCFQGRRNSR
jgi:hypothetical protein